MNPVIGPIAGRIKRPGWTDPRLIIGLVLIVLSVWGTVSLVSRADRTESFLVARTTLTPGTILEEGVVLIAHVRVDDGYVSADDPPWGSVITRTISQGELLPSTAIADPDDFDSRPVAVASSLPLAEGITRGAVVDVWLVKDGPVGSESDLIASGLVVDQVDRNTSAFTNGAETVYVMVPADEVGDFLAALTEEGEVAVVGMPGRTDP